MRKIAAGFKLLLVSFLLFLPAANLFAAPSRVFSHSATISTSASTIDFTFNPSTFCFSNDSATAVEVIYLNWITTASSANDAANIRVAAGETICFTFLDAVNKPFSFSIKAASGAPAYRAFGIAR